MTFDDYQKEALRTASNKRKLEVFTLGLVGEAGEVAELVKKHLGHDQPLHREKMVKELGDVLWYLSNLANLLGINLDEVASKNVEKLKLRYPNGFSPEESVQKKDERPMTATAAQILDENERAKRDVQELLQILGIVPGRRAPTDKEPLGGARICNCPVCVLSRGGPLAR